MRLVRCIIVILLLTGTTPAADRFFNSSGVTLRYIEQGRGNPVLLVHGFSRNIELTWAQSGILDALSRNHRVIALDCRGHGKSDKPKGPDEYGLKMVEDLVALLDHLKIEKVRVVGYSMGGRMALKLLINHPDRVDRAVLIGAGGSHKGDDGDFWVKVGDALQRGEGIGPLALKIWPTDRPGPAQEQIRDINLQAMAVNDSEALAAVARQYNEFAVTKEELRNTHVPVMAVIGSGDGFRPDVNTLLKRMPRIYVVVIRDANHLNILESPKLKKELTLFLKE